MLKMYGYQFLWQRLAMVWRNAKIYESELGISIKNTSFKADINKCRVNTKASSQAP